MGSRHSKRRHKEEEKEEASLVVRGSESLMCKKSHGTCSKGVQQNLRFGCDGDMADRICCYNRHFAEPSGYFLKTKWRNENDGLYYDSVTGALLFTAPRTRNFEDFFKESKTHGWPSFRDSEVDWTNVRVLDNGEVISKSGTHLGHNLPDKRGNRYCINLVSVAGRPTPRN